MSNERTPSTVCGRLVGTSTGWDEVDTWHIVLYGFQCTPESRNAGLKDCDLGVDWDNGWFCTVNDIGEVDWKIDMMEVLIKLPRAPE